MTERDWLASNDPLIVHQPQPALDPLAMLQYVRLRLKADRTKQGRRQLRLFACACCRRVWPSLNRHSREAVDLAERYADGLVTKKELGHAWKITTRGFERGTGTADHCAGHVAEAGALTSASLTAMVCYAVFAQDHNQHHELWGELYHQALIIRDIFGNPFHATTSVDPVWMSGNNEAILRKAQVIYDDRRYEELPCLGDMLEAAGCTDAEMLSHSRNGKNHYRGCWILDSLLGRR